MEDDMQAYSNRERDSDPYSLPDVEVFYWTREEATAYFSQFDEYADQTRDGGTGEGWYWWTCLPGCLPDSEPIGPFETKDAALADAQDEYEGVSLARAHGYHIYRAFDGGFNQC
jgi:hypothetical protein